MADGVYALMGSMKPPGGYTTGNSTRTESESYELPVGDDSVLERRKPGKPLVGRDGAFFPHTGNKSP